MSLRLSPWRGAIVIAIVARALAVPTAANAVGILCGETLVRQLYSGPEEIGFEALEGEVVSATVVPDAGSSGFAPRWRIHDVEGHPVLLSNGERRCTGRCQSAPLPRGTSFTLRVADSGVGTGSYVVSFEAVSATANGASNGPPTPTCARIVNGALDGTQALLGIAASAGVIDRPGETDTFTLDVAAGERVEIVLTRTGGDPAFIPIWEAFDATGARIEQTGAIETAPVAVSGVVTILIADGNANETGTYLVAAFHLPPLTTTTHHETTTTTTTVDGTTTTTGDEPTTSTTDAPASSTTTTHATPSTTSTTVVANTTTTVTVPGPTTTLPPPTFDLDVVVPGPVLGPQGMLGGAVAAVGGRVFIGAPHENVGRGRDRVRDAGAVLVVDVGGVVGSPTFGRVLARVARPEGPTSGDELGLSLAPAGTGVVVGAPGARLAFVFPNVQEAIATTIPPPVVSPDDGFGRAVAAPDGFVVVGAPGGAGGTGAAYVFERATGTLHTELKVPSPVAGARMGAALAASGGLVLVGAPGGAGVAGKAFLFDAKTGALLQTLVPDPSTDADEFGAAVAFAGDDLLIGAPGAGRVDRFEAATGDPVRSCVSPNPASNERFGAALAVDGGTLVVGAPGASFVAPGGGTVYVFDEATCVLAQTLQKPMPQPGDAFGTAVAAANGHVFVGTPGDDAGTLDGGTTYVFDGPVLVAVLRERLSADGFGTATAASDGRLYVGAPDGAGGAGYVASIEPGSTKPATTLTAPDPVPARFGASVAALGDLLVVGAPETTADAGERVGAVYLFDGSTQLRGTIKNPAPGAGDEFGFAVGSLGDDVLASAPFAGDSDTGLVYRMDTTGRLRVTYGKPAPAAGDFFGAALSGDQAQVLVGAPLDASGGPSAGAAYLFDGDSSAIVHAIPNPRESGDLFGAAVALGQWIAVGAPLAAEATGVVGTVWIFDRATGALVRRVENPRSGAYDSFGASLALLGDRLVVGAPLADDRVADAGLVYLFETATGELLQTFRNPPQGSFDNFGFAVSASAAGILVGSPGPSRVYLFDPIGPASGMLRVAAARVPFAVTAQCGNGLVEAGEACDDGNDIETDDCRNDCTAGLCCTLDVVADALTRCDDGNPCTKDVLDPVVGCRYEPNTVEGCCASDEDCQGGQCRFCVGCNIYRWDCCDVGSTCVPSNAACIGKTCVDAAFCQCEGKLDCGAEIVPDALRTPFATACDTLREQLSVEPEGTITKPQLVLARQRTRAARASLRKTVRTARSMSRAGQVSRDCRKQVIAQVRVVKQAIPRGKRLRRCLLAGG
jgi:cysteine-rich repeat protein